MNTNETRTADSKGRVTLPRWFADAPVIIERVSDTEVRIRKAMVVAEDEMRFHEESASPVTDRDRHQFLKLLDSPPKANATLKKAARSLVKRSPKRNG